MVNKPENMSAQERIAAIKKYLNAEADQSFCLPTVKGINKTLLVSKSTLAGQAYSIFGGKTSSDNIVKEIGDFIARVELVLSPQPLTAVAPAPSLQPLTAAAQPPRPKS